MCVHIIIYIYIATFQFLNIKSILYPNKSNLQKKKIANSKKKYPLIASLTDGVVVL